MSKSPTSCSAIFTTTKETIILRTAMTIILFTLTYMTITYVPVIEDKTESGHSNRKRAYTPWTKFWISFVIVLLFNAIDILRPCIVELIEKIGLKIWNISFKTPSLCKKMCGCEAPITPALPVAGAPTSVLPKTITPQLQLPSTGVSGTVAPKIQSPAIEMGMLGGY
jgi:hypothetical protein